MTEEVKQPDWITRMHEANARFNVENTPILRLATGLSQGPMGVPREFEIVTNKVEATAERMILVDTAPRHDTILSDELLKEVARNSYHHPMWAAHSRLVHSLQTIDEAFGNIQNVFRGELHAKYYERLARHRAEARSLVDLFSRLPNDDAVQPFSIRQRSMAGLYHEFCKLIDIITPLRRKFKPGELPTEYFDDLKDVEAELYRLRSSIARWRDNPSQRLGKKMQDCHRRTTKIALAVSRMRRNSQFDCQELGMVFCGRGGPIRVERWTPPPEGFTC